MSRTITSSRASSSGRDTSAYWPAAKSSPKYSPQSGDGTSYEQAQREAARRKKIQEYQTLIKGIKAVTTKFVDSSNILTNVGAIIMTSVTGNSSILMKNLIVNVQKEMKDIVNGLNSAGKRAAEEINKEGEPCTFNDAQAKTETTYKEQNKLQFSCDTKVLREKVLPELKKSMDKLTDTSKDASNLPKLAGCESISGTSGKIDGTKGEIKKIYENVKQLIENTEKAEEANKKIIEGLGYSRDTSAYWQREYDKQQEQIREGAKRSRTIFENNKEQEKQREIAKDTSAYWQRESDRQQEQKREEIRLLAEQQGITTNGKTIYEILIELAEKNGIDPTKSETVKHNTAEALQEWYKNRGTNRKAPQADIETWYYDIKDPQNKYNLKGLWTIKENGEPGGLLYQLGYRDMTIKLREDGVFMASGYKPDGTYFADKVLVAGDVYDKYRNPNGHFERGTEIMTTMGPGILLDYGEYADEHYSDVEGMINFEFATAWQTPEYYSKLKNGTLPVVEWEETNIVKKTADELLDEILKKGSQTSTEPTKLTTQTRISTRTTTPKKTTITTRTPTTPTTTRTSTRTTIKDISLSELAAMNEIIKLAEEMGISIQGKSKREILEEVALALDIPLLEEYSKNNSRIW